MQATRDRIRRAAERAGRDPSDVRLVAATKYVEASRVLDAIRVGLNIFGENRWQEARDKMQAVGERGNVEWHFIGRLQRRKLKWLAGRFNLIHSVESLEQAEEIQRRAHERHISQAILLEVNVGGEESKGGLSVDALPSAISQIDAFPSVCVQGLMTVPPWNPDPELMRPYFQRLKQLAELVSSLPLQRVRMRELSMGMSNDFEVAVEEGATLVRVGTALFGPRRETVVAES
ncbi:MAG: YggS family pyridoxal phosphate-dependent enzyme [Nitrospira sp. SB0661_bin_20]|nr:YggS family pyridoxal phosphate-dependent enzyme [Nitrospira sp. SB0661_bin_20]MYJ23677.1 YggS family pyridoxal phosphate-dependent enzyme [Nitrospira sp. SB0673_bin_12]